MLDADELAELVDAIAANGLRDPITIGRIGRERWIVDGRNRLKACEIAGVAPAYEEIEFADEDALREFVLDRNERRNITAGQKAMAQAILFPDASKLRRKGSGSFPGKEQVSESFLSKARTVLRHTPELGPKVRDWPKLNLTPASQRNGKPAGSPKERADSCAASSRGNVESVARLLAGRSRPRQQKRRRSSSTGSTRRSPSVCAGWEN